MVRAQSSTIEKESLSHNLQGQRLGRKGRDTRERIILATETLLAGPLGQPISLSAVAREASLGMTTLYLYFSDLPELLLAVLAPIMGTAEESYIAHLRQPWPDDQIGAHCLRFIEAYHAFWVRHSRILHLRNSYADDGDERMRANRIAFSRLVMELFVQQMEGDPAELRTPIYYMASVLMTGIERMITIATDEKFRNLFQEDREPHIRNLLRTEARLLELALCDGRAETRRASAA
jgi:AcrR family transcriptional regulator